MDKIWELYELGDAVESHAPTIFSFQLENILRSYLNFLKILLGLLLVSLYGFEKNFHKNISYRPPCPDGVDIAYVQTG